MKYLKSNEQNEQFVSFHWSPRYLKLNLIKVT